MMMRVVPGLVMMAALAAGLALCAPMLALAAPEAAGSVHGGDHTADAAHREGPPVDPLEFRSDSALWTGVVFLVLLVILWTAAWRPIANGLQKRERRIADEIDSAEQTNAEARKLLEEYQQKLAASGEEVRQMLEAARRDAEQTGQAVVEKARADAEAEHRRMLGEIELATANALKDLAQQSATLAVELAGKIVAAKLDPRAHSHLIEQAVGEFSRKQPGKN